MPINDCRIVATTPPYIQLILRTPLEEAPDARPERWKLQRPPGKNGKLLKGWIASTRGRPVAGGYAYTLRAGPDAKTDWVEPGSVVRVITTFPEETEDDRQIDCVVEPASDSSKTSEDLGGLRDGIEDLVGFPVITGTSDVVGTGGGPGGSGGPGGQALVDAEIRRALGRTPTRDDVTGTLALLDRSMQLEVENGVERWTVARNAYVVQAQNGAGVTGRQASLAGLAQETLAFIQPLAEGVEQLAPRTDNPALLESARSNFLAAAKDAVAEAGVPGGPVVPKASVFLDQSITQLARFGSELGVLHAVRHKKDDDGDKEREKGKFVPTRVNVVTPRDEDQFTAFLVILERWRVLHDAFRDYLGEGPMADEVFAFKRAQADFGLEFTLLERVVDVIAEAVDELDVALLSVGIDRREREAMRLGAGMTIADVMDWAQGFAEREARPLIQQSGVQGVTLLPARLGALAEAVEQLQERAEAVGAPRGLRHPRVKVAIDKLLRELRRAKRRAEQAQAVTQD